MALTFPRDLPDYRVEKANFRIQRFDELAPEAGGRQGALQTGFPLWELTLEFGPGLLPQASEEWQAFVDSLNGPANLFYGRSLKRDYPVTYPDGFDGMTRAGGGAFPADGLASAWSPDVSRTKLTLSGLPANFWLKRGDLVGFRWANEDSGDPRRAVVRIMEDRQAGGDGSAQWEVRPSISRVVPSDAEAYLYRPTCLMRQDTARSTLDGCGADAVVGGTFVGVQDLLA